MKHLFFLLTLLLCLPLAAQQTYRARVVDAETGEALPYAQVYVSAGHGALTDGEGWFTLDARAEDVLRITYIGYNTMEVKAGEIGKSVSLSPMTTDLQEVMVIPAEKILLKMLERLDKEFLRKENKRSNYFYRLTNTYTGKRELVEAYLTARSACNLRDINFYAGRRMKETAFTAYHSGISYTNMHYLMELGPVVKGSLKWKGIYSPFNPILNAENISLEQDFGINRLDKAHFTFSGQTMEGDNGSRIFKISMQGHSEKSFVDGAVYVDAKRYQLLCFEGELHNFALDLEKDLHRESSTVKPKVRITYSHRRGFTEVESMVVTMESGELQSHSVLMNLDGQELPFKNKYMTASNLIESIEQTDPDTTLWRAANIQRTEAEEILVRRHALERSDLKDWVYAERDDTYDNIGPLRPYIERLAAFGKTIPQEKVYIHMDNTCYFQGDTIWFAAYTRKTSTDTPSDVSGVLYVELLNQDGYLVERKLIEMKEGRGNGFFALNNEIQYSGFYELRAYTRWQLNWGCFEHKHSKVACEEFGLWNKENERLFFRDYEKLYSRVFPVYDRPREPGNYTHDMTLRALRRTFKKDMDEKERELTLTLYPEGGNLVAGIPNRVAFEAVMSDGQWLRGSLTQQPHPQQPHPQPLTPSLRSPTLTPDLRCSEERGVPAVSRGRGVFTIVPERGMEREVTFTTEDGQTVKATLPKPEERGVALCVTENGKELKIQATANDAALASHLGMTIMHEGRVEEFLTFRDSVLTFDFVPAIYRAGVHQVTVFDDEGRVWADRLFFSRGKESFQPNITIKADKEQYDPQQPIVLDIETKPHPQPLSEERGESIISLAVRDKAHQDYLFDNATILTEMLLSSEIRGFVPDPGWFFEADDSLRRAALDLLMMTQGWRRFNWRDMAVRGEWDLTQPDEKVPIIEGRVIKYHGEPDTLYEKMVEESLEHMEKAQRDADNIGKKSIDPRTVEKQEAEKKERIRKFLEADPKDIVLSKEDKTRETTDIAKGKEIRVHAELHHTEDGSVVAHEMDTKEHRFRIHLPRFYGKSLFFLSAADPAKLAKERDYTWVLQTIRATDEFVPVKPIEDPDYISTVTWHYPRFVKPYSFYQMHLSASSDSLDVPSELLADTAHLMKQVTVRARRNALLRFNDSQPVLVLDAYEAENIGRDAGCNLIFSILHGYGLEMPYVFADNGEKDHRIRYVNGLSPMRRGLPQYIDIPTDSLYSPKYLKSFMGLRLEPGEVKYYKLDYLDRIFVYTDYSPRLEGSRRYQGNNLPETRIASYPYYDGSRRPVYRDRRYMIDGFARPAEFYSPNYSRYKLPEGQKDYRRTLYWNPNLQLDSEGRARVTLYNNSRTTQIEVEAAGQAADGTLLWNR